MNQPPVGIRDASVLVFMRAPELGRVKTRLSRMLEPSIVLDLYKCFVADTLAAITSAGYPPTPCIHPPTAVGSVTAWLGPGVEMIAQEGRDIGARMANAFRKAFASGCTRAILVGTDIPDLPSGVYRQAFEALARSAAVIGPSLDGGYYLIGFRHDTFLPDIFERMAWGTDRVFEQTRNILAAKRISVQLLPSWRDIDDYEDLIAFARSPGSGAGETRACLNRLTRLSNRFKSG